MSPNLIGSVAGTAQARSPSFRRRHKKALQVGADQRRAPRREHLQGFRHTGIRETVRSAFRKSQRGNQDFRFFSGAFKSHGVYFMRCAA